MIAPGEHSSGTPQSSHQYWSTTIQVSAQRYTHIYIWTCGGECEAKEGIMEAEATTCLGVLASYVPPVRTRSWSLRLKWNPSHKSGGFSKLRHGSKSAVSAENSRVCYQSVEARLAFKRIFLFQNCEVTFTRNLNLKQLIHQCSFQSN